MLIFGRLGSVLYKMLTGRRAFLGETIADTLAAILDRDPDWTKLPAGLPPSVDRLLRLCLQRTMKNRRQAAGDVRVDIEQIFGVGDCSERLSGSRPREVHVAWLAVAAALVVLSAALAFSSMWRAQPLDAEIRLQIVTPSTRAPFKFALSPDGRSLVFVASGNGSQRLWLRALENTEAKPMAGTEAPNIRSGRRIASQLASSSHGGSTASTLRVGHLRCWRIRWARIRCLERGRRHPVCPGTVVPVISGGCLWRRALRSHHARVRSERSQVSTVPSPMAGSSCSSPREPRRLRGSTSLLSTAGRRSG